MKNSHRLLLFACLRKRGRYLYMGMLLIFFIFHCSMHSIDTLLKNPVPDHIEERVKNIIADQYGLQPKFIKIINSTEVDYPCLGAKAYSFKTYNTNTNEIYGLLLDNNGQELNPDQMEIEEHAAHYANFGKMDEELYEFLKTYSSTERIQVCLWLKQPKYNWQQRPDGKSDMSQEQVEEFYLEAREQGVSFNAEVVNPVVGKLHEFDMDVQGDLYAPIIFISLTKNDIEEIAQWPEVDQLFLSHIYSPCMNVARVTVGASALQKLGNTGGSPFQANNVRVAIVESSFGGVDQNHPFLPPITQDYLTCNTVSAHATQMAGIITCTHPHITGIAPGATLWLGAPCKPQTSKLTACTGRALQWNASVFNYSFSFMDSNNMTSFDKYVDDISNKYHRTFIIGSGNIRQDGKSYVGSPGKSYNGITVGGCDDKNEPYRWAKHTMWDKSCFADPYSRHTDREKPEVVAPAKSIAVINSTAPWDLAGYTSGTSHATAIVSGCASLLINEKRSLALWPEAIKAVLMTGATHNVVKENNFRDGAGMVDVYHSNTIIKWKDPYIRQGIEGDFGTVNFVNTRPGSIPKNQELARMIITAGKRTRAAIVWSQPTTYNDYKNQPSTDFDLWIDGPSGEIVTRSVSFDCTFELVDFIPQKSGVYTLRMSKYRCNETPPYLAWAWFQLN